MFVFACMAAVTPSVRAQELFQRGDVNQDDAFDVSDPISTLLFLFRGGVTVLCEKAADADDSGAIDVTDPVYSLSALLTGGAPPPWPYPVCGTDLTPDELTCEASRCDPEDSPLIRVAATSPAVGESRVATTRETIITFSSPFPEGTVFPADNVTMEASDGEEVPVIAVLSPMGDRLTIFPQVPMPASAEISVVLYPDGLADSFGLEPDFEGDGVPGGAVLIQFDTLGTTPYPGTTVVGRVFQSDRVLSGELPNGEPDDELRTPLGGIRITIEGLPPCPDDDCSLCDSCTTTDEDGNFRLDNAPAGEFFVTINGFDAVHPDGEPGYYPLVGKKWVAVGGVENVIGNIYLPFVVDGTLQQVSDEEETEIGLPRSVIEANPDLDLELLHIRVPPGAGVDEFGGRFPGRVGIAPVDPSRLPGPLPPGAEARLVVTVQAFGVTNFDIPVSICFPNLEGAEPGTRQSLLSFDHDSGEWEYRGSMTVTEDGTQVCTDPGAGITAPGWHMAQPGSPAAGGGASFSSSTQANPNSPDEQPFAAPGNSQRGARSNDTKSPSGGGASCSDLPANPGDPVYPHSGQLYTREVDLRIRGVGMDFVWARRFLSTPILGGSASRAYRDELGGWDPSYNIRLSSETRLPTETRRVIDDGNGRKEAYVLSSAEDPEAPGQRVPAYVKRGFFRVLVHRPEDEEMVLYFEDGGKWVFPELGGPVTRIEDRNGNALTFSYERSSENGINLLLSEVVDTMGRRIVIERDADRIVAVEDTSTGRRVTYDYYETRAPGGVEGMLRSVTTPPVERAAPGNAFATGKTRTYTYNIRADGEESPFSIVDARRNDPADPTHGDGPYLRFWEGPKLRAPWPLEELRQAHLWELAGSAIEQASERRRWDVRQELGGATYDFSFEQGIRSPSLVRLVPAPPCRDLSLGTSGGTQTANGRAAGVVVGGLSPPEFCGGFFAVPLRPEDVQTRLINNDRNGRVTEWLHDGSANLREYREYTGFAPDADSPSTSQDDIDFNMPDAVRAGEPDFYATHYEYARNRKLSEVRRPNGNVRRYEYSGRGYRDAGNLTGIILDPGTHSPSGEQAMIVRGYEYDSSFNDCCGGSNFVSRATDGLGNDWEQEFDDRGNVVRQIHRVDGIVEEFEHNEWGQVTLHRHPDNGSGHRREDRFEYFDNGDRPGYLQRRIVDANGEALVTEFAYDAVGNITRVIDPRGSDTLFTVNELDQVVRIETRRVDAGGVDSPRYARHIFYDANDNVARVDTQNVDENGDIRPNAWLTTIYEYDILDHVVRKMEEVGDARLEALDTQGGRARAVLSRDEMPAALRDEFVVTEYEYDANRNLVEVRYGEATRDMQADNVVRFEYDGRDLLYRVTRGYGGDNPSTTQYDYDGNKNLIRVTAGLESDAPRVTKMVYDGYDRRVEMRDPMGNVVRTTYDANGNVTRMVVEGELEDEPDSDDNVLLYAVDMRYDAKDRLVEKSAEYFDARTGDPLGDGEALTQYAWADISRLLSVTNDNGHARQLRYDGAHRLAEETDAAGNRREFEYDANGNIIALVAIDRSDLGSPDQVFRQDFVYDGLDRIVSRIDGVGNRVDLAYDSRDNLTRLSDALRPEPEEPGNIMRYEYDGLDRLIATVRRMTDTGRGDGDLIADGEIRTEQEWDHSSRLTAQIDDSGNATRYEYDGLDRVVAFEYGDGTRRTASFDAHDDPIVTVDANGNVVTGIFDGLGRLVEREIDAGPGVDAATTFERYAYDGLSRLVSGVDDDSTVERAYDSLSRVIEESLNGRTVTTQRDALGNALACDYPGGRRVECTFDELERMSSISDSAGAIATYAYVGPSRVERLDRGNGTRTDFTYDGIEGVPDPAGDFGFQRIRRVQHTSIATGLPFDDRELHWDEMGTKTRRASLLGGGRVETLDYDSIHRLVQSDESGGGLGNLVTGFELDGVGNRVGVTENGAAQSPAYSMSNARPPDDLRVNQYTETPFDARVHDENGNLVEIDPHGPAAPWTISRDYRDQMVALAVGSEEPTLYRYDVLGRRIEKITGPVVDRRAERYSYDGWRVIEEQDASGQTLATYAYGNYVDEVLEMHRDGDRYFFHADDLFHVTAVTDATGAVRERYEYGAYGQPTVLDAAGGVIASTAIGNPYRFTGRRFDEESGFYYYRTRYLDPLTGRFNSRDRIGVWGDPDSLGNANAALENSPWSSLDPLGTDVITCEDNSFPWHEEVLIETTKGTVFTDLNPGENPFKGTVSNVIRIDRPDGKQLNKCKPNQKEIQRVPLNEDLGLKLYNELAQEKKDKKLPTQYHWSGFGSDSKTPNCKGYARSVEKKARELKRRPPPPPPLLRVTPSFGAGRYRLH